MNVRVSGRSRLAAAAVIACLAIGVPAVALAASSAPRARNATPQCPAQSTEVWLGLNPDGATAGTNYYPLEFTNVGHGTCWLRGYPGVSALNGSGGQLGRPASHAGRRHTVTLKPGQTAHALVGIVQAGFITCHLATAHGLGVYPPGQTTKQPIYNFTFTACTNKVDMHVGPVQVGVGIP